MGDKSNLLNILFAILVFMIGLMYLEGLFHKGQGTVIKTLINWDKIFFPNLNNETLIRKADKVAFIICLILAILILLNGLLAYFYNVPNLSFIFILSGIFGSWIIRMLYLYFSKGK